MRVLQCLPTDSYQPFVQRSVGFGPTSRAGLLPMRPLAPIRCPLSAFPAVLFSRVRAVQCPAGVFTRTNATCYRSGIQLVFGLLAYRWNIQQVSVPSSQHACGRDVTFVFTAGAHFPGGSHACREREPNVSSCEAIIKCGEQLKALAEAYIRALSSRVVR